MKDLGEVQEIAQNLAAVFTGDAFGMKLHPECRAVTVLNAHDNSIVGLRAHLELRGGARSLDDERGIARRRKGSVQTTKEPARIVRNARHLAMHRRWRAHDIAAEGLSDRLMTKADPEHWRRSARRANEIDTNARFVRRARTGGEDDGVRFVGERIGDRDLVVAPNRHVRAQLAEVVDEVEREAVIVVDERDALHPGFRTPKEPSFPMLRRARQVERASCDELPRKLARPDVEAKTHE